MIAISEGTVAAIVAMLALDLFVVIFALSYTRARRRGAQPAGGVLGGLPTPPRSGRSVTRREFFRRSLVSSLAVFAAQFGGASLAFMWPNLKGGFGAVIAAGKIDAIKNQISSSGEPFYMGTGRFYLVAYRGSGQDRSTGADYVGENVTAQGLMPLYQRCVHLGCRVPYCKASGWFECPCHGSKYNAAGEYELGPAPRGLDRFQIDIDQGGNVFVDTSQIILGPPRGTDTIDEPPQGPFCVATG